MVLIGAKIDEVRTDGSLEVLKRDLDAHANIGLEAAEIPVHGLDAIKNGRLDEKRVSETVKILSQYDFTYSVHSPNPLNLMDKDNINLHLSVFDASLRFTEAIGSRIMVYHAGRFVPEEKFFVYGKNRVSPAEQEDLLKMEREHLVRLSESRPDVVICVENARPYLEVSPYCYSENLQRLLEQVQRINRPNVKIILDIGHLFMASKFYRFDPIEATGGVKGRIAHMHIHDNFGGSAHHYEKMQTHQIPFGKGDSHMPVGWGDVPVREILAACLNGYEGMLMMELRSRYFGDTEESKQNLEAILDGISMM